MQKVLIIRFSSFGDVLQTLSVAGAFAESWPNCKIDWVTREEFRPLVEGHPAINRVWSLNRSEGFSGLRQLSEKLRNENYSHVYDAHNNLRSRWISWRLGGIANCRRWLGGPRVLRRSIFRFKRFLLFRLRINLFPQPFDGQRDLLLPLRKWGIATQAPEVPQLFLPAQAQQEVRNTIGPLPKEFIALAPSAAFPLKRWPLAHWRDLIALSPDLEFVILGGPGDSFVEDLVKVAPSRVHNLAGRLSLVGSAEIINEAKLLVSNDTGLLHVAEQLGKPCIALMGPAPFGFPSRPRTKIMQLDLACRPCSKHGQGPCVNSEFQKCLAGISPASVKRELELLMAEGG